jgi:hypothetical protein
MQNKTYTQKITILFFARLKLKQYKMLLECKLLIKINENGAKTANNLQQLNGFIFILKILTWIKLWI